MTTVLPKVPPLSCSRVQKQQKPWLLATCCPRTSLAQPHVGLGEKAPSLQPTVPPVLIASCARQLLSQQPAKLLA